MTNVTPVPMQVLTRLISHFAFPQPFQSFRCQIPMKKKGRTRFPGTKGNFIETHLIGPPNGTTPFRRKRTGLKHTAENNLGQVRGTQLEKTQCTQHNAHWPMVSPQPLLAFSTRPGKMHGAKEGRAPQKVSTISGTNLTQR